MRRLRDIRSPSTAASQLRSSRRAPLGAGERFNASQAAMLKSLRAVRPLAAGAIAVYFHQPLAEFGILFNHGRMRNQYSVSKSMRVGHRGSVAQGCRLTPRSTGKPTAGRAAAVFLFCIRAAGCRFSVSSNVRPHRNQLHTTSNWIQKAISSLIGCRVTYSGLAPASSQN